MASNPRREPFSSDHWMGLALFGFFVAVIAMVTVALALGSVAARVPGLVLPLVAVSMVFLAGFLVRRLGTGRLELMGRTFSPPSQPAGLGAIWRRVAIPYGAVTAIGIARLGRYEYAFLDLKGPWVCCHFRVVSTERRRLVTEIARRSGQPLMASWNEFLEFPLVARRRDEGSQEEDARVSSHGSAPPSTLAFRLLPKALQKWLFLQVDNLKDGEPGLVVGGSGLQATLKDGRRLLVERKEIRRFIVNSQWISAECYGGAGDQAKHFALMMKVYSESDRAKLLDALRNLGEVVEPRDHVFLLDDLRIEAFYALGS